MTRKNSWNKPILNNYPVQVCIAFILLIGQHRHSLTETFDDA